MFDLSVGCDGCDGVVSPWFEEGRIVESLSGV